jgi:hypothetical protein
MVYKPTLAFPRVVFKNWDGASGAALQGGIVPWIRPGDEEDVLKSAFRSFLPVHLRTGKREMRIADG